MIVDVRHFRNTDKCRMCPFKVSQKWWTSNSMRKLTKIEVWKNLENLFKSCKKERLSGKGTA